MDKKDKDLLYLLLKDLCARLLYRVKVRYHYKRNDKVIDEDRELDFSDVETLKYNNEYPQDDWCEISWKPYLRPMSSMTQGEWEEMTALIYPHGRVNRNPDNKNELLLWLSAEGNEMPIILMNNVFSWLNEHYFDYHGLIEKGLALEAPKGMYV